MSEIDTTQIWGRGENATFIKNTQGLNVVSNYLFADFLLIALFIFMIFLLRDFKFSDSLLLASVVGFIASLFMLLAGIVDFTRPMVLFALIVVAYLFSSTKE